MGQIIKSLRIFIPFVLIGFSVSAEQGIEVIGKASVQAMPDQYSLTISIKERGRVASKVKQLVDHKSNQVVKMFQKQGVNATDIDSSIVRMYPFYEKPSIELNNSELRRRSDRDNTIVTAIKSNPPNEQKIRMFDVGRTITVKLSSLQQYDRILDKLVKIGVSHISPIELGFKDPEALYEKALSKALSHAKNKANNIAGKLGISVGGVIAIKESGYHAPVTYRMARLESDAGFQSQSTERAISAQVIVVYQIVQ